MPKIYYDADADLALIRGRKVAILGTADIQLIGMVEHVGIAVGGADHWSQELASAYHTAPDLHISYGSSPSRLNRRIEAQKFLDGLLHQCWLRAQSLELAGPFHQRKYAVAN